MRDENRINASLITTGTIDCSNLEYDEELGIIVFRDMSKEERMDVIYEVASDINRLAR